MIQISSFFYIFFIKIYELLIKNVNEELENCQCGSDLTDYR